MKPGLSARLATLAIRVWVRWLYVRLWFRLRNYRNNQTALARQYVVEGLAPEPYGPSTRERVIRLAEASGEEKRYAWTSGTTSEPKQIFYPERRARRLQRTLLEQVLLAYDYARVTRPAFYLLTSMAPDKSWSSIFIRRSFAPIANRLLLSGSILYVPHAAELVGRFSQTSVHVALWLLCEPAVIVTANPSSLYVIIEQVAFEWERIRSQIKSILQDQDIYNLQQSVVKLDAARQTKINRILDSAAPPPVHILLPALEVIYCWDGGYVQPFIDNLKKQFAAHPVKFVPMFSMSTETVAYQMYPHMSTRGGLPVYPGNCYEFFRTECAKTTQNILKPWQLETGKEYVMIISDSFGLKRYDTEDVFECRGMNRDTPILHFSGRIGLRYSFTGEKITAEQLLETYESLRRDFGLDGAIFTCFPRLNPGSIPGYVFVYCAMHDDVPPPGLTAYEFDRRLMELNEEYATKRKSGRLAPPQLVHESYALVASRIRKSNPHHEGSNPAQFKLLPLYKVMWEDLRFAEGGNQ